MKNLCKLPGCPRWALPRKDYCRKHTHELNEKSKEYLKELKSYKPKKIKLSNGSEIHMITSINKIKGMERNLDVINDELEGFYTRLDSQLTLKQMKLIGKIVDLEIEIEEYCNE